MATKRPGWIGWLALLAPLVIVLVAYLWLEDQVSDALSDWIAAAVAVFVMGYSVFLATRVNRRLDEVEIAGQRFAVTQGMTFGAGAAVLVMLVPPAADLLVDLAYFKGPELPDKAVRTGIFIGMMLAVIMQLLVTIAVSIWWGRRLMGQQE
jgi:hypothetical protein